MKKLPINISVPFFFLLLGLFTSCEELVEADTPSNQIGTTQVFEDVQTANAALAGVYASLRNQSVISGNNFGTGALTGSYTDDLDCFYNDQNGYMDIFLSQQQATNTSIERLWDLSYQQIYASNSIIYGTQNSVALPQDDKNRIRGEALIVRSLIYLYLQQLFGEIPYTTSLDYEYNSQLSKLAEHELLQQLQLDLTEATSLLEDNYNDPARIYPNRKVAELLKAQVYLLQGEWANAEQTAQSILQSSLYQFQTDINEVFHNTGAHILWQLKPQNNGDSTQEASFYFFSDGPPNAYALSQDLINTFSDEDLRKQNWTTMVSVGENIWYRPSKYKNLSGANTNENSIIFRLEEVYFIMAEALAQQNRITEALPYLNAIRQRAGLTSLVSVSLNEFMDELILEKRREFFTEFAHRFFDLKRLGRLYDLSNTKPNWMPFHKVWPLPQKELLLNGNLNPQNEGY